MGNRRAPTALVSQARRLDRSLDARVRAVTSVFEQAKVWYIAGQIVECYQEAGSNRPQEKDVRNLHINSDVVSAPEHSKANH